MEYLIIFANQNLERVGGLPINPKSDSPILPDSSRAHGSLAFRCFREDALKSLPKPQKIHDSSDFIADAFAASGDDGGFSVALRVKVDGHANQCEHHGRNEPEGSA
jgi:hypothetical protein